MAVGASWFAVPRLQFSVCSAWPSRLSQAGLVSGRDSSLVWSAIYAFRLHYTPGGHVSVQAMYREPQAASVAGSVQYSQEPIHDPSMARCGRSPGISALLLRQWRCIRDGQYELALRLSSFQKLMGFCSLSQWQHAADFQFQPACSYSRNDVICALHQLLGCAQIIL